MGKNEDKNRVGLLTASGFLRFAPAPEIECKQSFRFSPRILRLLPRMKIETLRQVAMVFQIEFCVQTCHTF